MQRTTLPLALGTLCTAAAMASAQTTPVTVTLNLFEHEYWRPFSAKVYDALEVQSVGEVTGDAFTDFMVSFPGLSARVISGAETYQWDHSLGFPFYRGSFPIHRSYYEVPPSSPPVPPEPPPPLPPSQYGYDCAAAGDVDGDGSTDFVVGAPTFGDSQLGRAFVYLDSSMPQKVELLGTVPDDRFGWDVKGVGDVDGDGFDEVAVGAPGGIGKVYVFSGAVLAAAAGGSVAASASTWQLDAGAHSALDDNFGHVVRAGGDTDGDQRADLLFVAAPGVVGSVGFATGAVFAFTLDASLQPPNTAQSWVRTGKVMCDNVGVDIDVVGSYDADGVPDLLVGAQEAVPGMEEIGCMGMIHFGYAWVLSGADGTILETWEYPGDMMDTGIKLEHFPRFGAYVAGDSDLDGDEDCDFDGDGSSDLAISAYRQGEASDPHSYSGATYLYRGAPSPSGMGDNAMETNWMGNDPEGANLFGTTVDALGEALSLLPREGDFDQPRLAEYYLRGIDHIVEVLELSGAIEIPNSTAPHPNDPSLSWRPGPRPLGPQWQNGTLGISAPPGSFTFLYSSLALRAELGGGGTTLEPWRPIPYDIYCILDKGALHPFLPGVPAQLELGRPIPLDATGAYTEPLDLSGQGLGLTGLEYYMQLVSIYKGEFYASNLLALRIGP